MISIVFLWILQPNIGIRSVDAYAYIVGSFSIHDGKGYVSLGGELLNHWPPGYSFILSLFSSPIFAAQIINYLSFGLSIGLIYFLARKNNWACSSALGFSLAIGFGFFRSLVNNVMPDILTYAVFLLACAIFFEKLTVPRVWSYLFWAVLIPLKLIAVVFIPAAIFTRIWITGISCVRRQRGEFLIASLLWSFFLGSILVFNYISLGVLIPASHGGPDIHSILQELKSFASSIPRFFLSHWYGTIKNLNYFLLFSIELLIGVVCLLTLKLKDKKFFVFSIILIFFFLLLQCVREYGGAVRLTGYGFCMVVLPSFLQLLIL